MNPEIKSQPAANLAVVLISVSVGALVALGSDIAGLGTVGILLISSLAFVAASSVHLAFRGRPAFVISGTGICFSTLRDEIAWDEIEAIKEAGHDAERLRLQVVVRDPTSIMRRVIPLYRPVVVLYRIVGLLPWRLAMYDWDTKLSIDDLETELNRRAGRQIVERRVFGNSLSSKLLRHLVYTSERPRGAGRADDSRG